MPPDGEIPYNASVRPVVLRPRPYAVDTPPGVTVPPGRICVAVVPPGRQSPHAFPEGHDLTVPFYLIVPDPDCDDLGMRVQYNGYNAREHSSYWGLRVHVFHQDTDFTAVLNAYGNLHNAVCF